MQLEREYQLKAGFEEVPKTCRLIVAEASHINFAQLLCEEAVDSLQVQHSLHCLDL